MYLSRMYLNPQRRQGRALLASPQKMHAAVLSSFPPIPVESDERVNNKPGIPGTTALCLIVYFAVNATISDLPRIL